MAKVTKLIKHRLKLTICVLIAFSYITWNEIYTGLCNIAHELTCRKRLPQSLIIGAPKCGTAALANYLSFHPDVSIDKENELFFFSTNFKLGFNWYIDNLPCSQSNQLVIERSSQYSVYKSVPERVWGMDPKVKIILVVCEPVRRLISHFAMRVEHGRLPNSSFEKFFFRKEKDKPRLIERFCLRGSKYYLNFPKWLELFTLKQIHIVDGDKLRTKPYPEVAATERFLGLKKRFTKSGFVYNETKQFYCYKPDYKQDLMCLGSGKGRKHPYVNEHVKQYLREYFKPYNKLFFRLSKRHFDW